MLYSKYQLPSSNSYREKSNVKVSSTRPLPAAWTDDEDQTITHILLRNVHKNYPPPIFGFYDQRSFKKSEVGNFPMKIQQNYKLPSIKRQTDREMRERKTHFCNDGPSNQQKLHLQKISYQTNLLPQIYQNGLYVHNV